MAYNSYGGSAPMGRGRGFASPSFTSGINPAGAGPEDPRRGPPGRGTRQHPGYGASSVMQTGSHYPAASHHGGYGNLYGNSASPTTQASPHSAQGHPIGQHPGMSGRQNAGSRFESSSNSDTQRPTGESEKIANDCEIIVLNKSQQSYAEMVEKQLQNVGLKADIMFTKPGVNLTEFVKPFAKSGLIFAVIISPENEEARSVNFYQFRGLTKPHYNKHVPLAVTAGLLLKKYNELEEKEIGPVPETVKRSLSRLINEELLNDLDYEEVLSFFRERKAKQYLFRNRTSNVEVDTLSKSDLIASTPECIELQKRILDILENDLGF